VKTETVHHLPSGKMGCFRKERYPQSREGRELREEKIIRGRPHLEEMAND
jgi:hypothetical protein